MGEVQHIIALYVINNRIKDNRYHIDTCCFYLSDLRKVSFNDLLEHCDFFSRETANVFPSTLRKNAQGRMKAVDRIWFLNTDFHCSIIKSLRMYELRLIVQRQKWIHHDKASLPRLKASAYFCVAIFICRRSALT